jgi:WD40 repeat protein
VRLCGCKVHTVDWSSDGTLLATGSKDGSLRLCCPRAALDDRLHSAVGMELRGHLGPINRVRSSRLVHIESLKARHRSEEACGTGQSSASAGIG